MDTHDPHYDASGVGTTPDRSFKQEAEQMLDVGNKFLDFAGGVVTLAGLELKLAVHTAPKVLMLWLLMMPVILLLWFSFSILIAWIAYANSGLPTLGLFVLFLQQLILLLLCRWLYLRFHSRMTFAYTRAQIADFLRSQKHEATDGSKI